jgi:hypothetical protein
MKNLRLQRAHAEQAAQSLFHEPRRPRPPSQISVSASSTRSEDPSLLSLGQPNYAATASSISSPTPSLETASISGGSCCSYASGTRSERQQQPTLPPLASIWDRGTRTIDEESVTLPPIRWPGFVQPQQPDPSPPQHRHHASYPHHDPSEYGYGAGPAVSTTLPLQVSTDSPLRPSAASDVAMSPPPTPQHRQHPVLRRTSSLAHLAQACLPHPHHPPPSSILPVEPPAERNDRFLHHQQHRRYPESSHGDGRSHFHQPYSGSHTSYSPYGNGDSMRRHMRQSDHPTQQQRHSPGRQYALPPLSNLVSGWSGS